MLDAPNATHGLQRYWRSAFTERIPDELIHVLVDGASRFSSPLSAIIFFYMHGAATRVPSTETAFAPRRPLWDRSGRAIASAGGSADHVAWVKSLWGSTEPHLLGTAYVNHLSSDDRPERVRASFGETTEGCGR